MLLTKNLDTPDEMRSFEHGELAAVSLGGVTFARAEFRPGWRWSKDLKPLVGTDSCQVTHQAIVISGRLRVKMDTGEERELAAGDAHLVGPGHDAWVVGEEPCVILDFETEPQKSSESTSERAAGVPTLIAACPCGVTFQIESDEALDHLVAAVQEHALGSHDHNVTREHILEELKSPSVARARA
jgi:mannose-6-phosphate isomerase-like protein (cupin superfamily)